MNKEVLTYKLSLLKERIAEDDWWFYNLQSIDNFIFHLESIKTERQREKVYNKIMLYLYVVEERLGKEDKYLSLKNLEPLLHELSLYYHFDADFIVKPNLFIHVISLMIIIVVLKLTFNTKTALIIGLSGSVILSIYYWIKIRLRRFF